MSDSPDIGPMPDAVLLRQQWHLDARQIRESLFPATLMRQTEQDVLRVLESEMRSQGVRGEISVRWICSAEVLARPEPGAEIA